MCPLTQQIANKHLLIIYSFICSYVFKLIYPYSSSKLKIKTQKSFNRLFEKLLSVGCLRLGKINLRKTLKNQISHLFIIVDKWTTWEIFFLYVVYIPEISRLKNDWFQPKTGEQFSRLDVSWISFKNRPLFVDLCPNEPGYIVQKSCYLRVCGKYAS